VFHHTAFRGSGVVRDDGECGGDAGIERRDLRHRISRRVRTDPDDQVRATCGARVGADLHYPGALRGGQIGRFGRGAEGHESGRAVFENIAGELLQCGAIEFVVRGEWGDEGDEESFERHGSTMTRQFM